MQVMVGEISIMTAASKTVTTPQLATGTYTIIATSYKLMHDGTHTSEARSTVTVEGMGEPEQLPSNVYEILVTKDQAGTIYTRVTMVNGNVALNCKTRDGIEVNFDANSVKNTIVEIINSPDDGRDERTAIFNALTSLDTNIGLGSLIGIQKDSYEYYALAYMAAENQLLWYHQVMKYANIVEAIFTFGTMAVYESSMLSSARSAVISEGERMTVNVQSIANGRYRYNMIENPGPLVEIDIGAAGTFATGRYNAITLQEDIIFYRTGKAGGGRNSLGQYWSRTAPESQAIARIDYAIKPQWIDRETGALTGTSPLESVYKVKIPKGTTIYEGPAGFQSGVYLGGKEQIFIKQPWNIPGVEVLSETQLP